MDKVDKAVQAVKAVLAVKAPPTVAVREARDLLRTRLWPKSSSTSTSDLAIGDTYRTV